MHREIKQIWNHFQCFLAYQDKHPTDDLAELDTKASIVRKTRMRKYYGHGIKVLATHLDSLNFFRLCYRKEHFNMILMAYIDERSRDMQ